LYNHLCIGDWPSGKALGSGPRIGGSNPSSPAKHEHNVAIAIIYSDLVDSHAIFGVLILVDYKYGIGDTSRYDR
jgi:hypothetical protein